MPKKKPSKRKPRPAKKTESSVYSWLFEQPIARDLPHGGFLGATGIPWELGSPARYVGEHDPVRTEGAHVLHEQVPLGTCGEVNVPRDPLLPIHQCYRPAHHAGPCQFASVARTVPRAQAAEMYPRALAALRKISAELHGDTLSEKDRAQARLDLQRAELIGQSAARSARWTDLENNRRITPPFVAYPIPLLLWCPECGERHVDEGDFATKPHHTHSCQHCGHTWRPAVVETVGVQFLPGFRTVK